MKACKCKESRDDIKDITKEDIAKWVTDPVTKSFMEYVDETIDDSDNKVHLALERNEMHEAHLFNSGKVMLAEVKGIPDRMIEDKIEEVEDGA